MTAAAVLGFIVGGLATLGGIFLFVGSSFLVGVDDGSGIGDTFAGIFIVIGLLVVTIAVIMIWGSVLALTGRSRVLLIVGASLLTAFGAIGLLGNLGDTNTTTGGGIAAQLVSLIITILIIVLLSHTPAAQYFAAQRARRGTLIR